MLRLVIWPSMMLLGRTNTMLWTLKYGSKSIQTSLILRQRPPKAYKLLQFLISFVTVVKPRHSPTIWKKLSWKSLCLLILKSITEIIKRFWAGDAASKFETFVWILSHISRYITWTLLSLKASYLINGIDDTALNNIIIKPELNKFRWKKINNLDELSLTYRPRMEKDDDRNFV